MPARIVFAGSPDFAVPCLHALVSMPVNLAAVITQPDRLAGRGRKLKASPVKHAALELGLPLLQPQSLRDNAVKAELAELAPDLMVVAAFGLLFPPDILHVPERGCINVHASLLPRWRGASPVHAAILAGDRETGVCLMQMEPGLDTGPVFSVERTQIGTDETAGELEARLARLGAALLRRGVPAILAGELVPAPQPARGATHAGRLTKADGLLDWSEPADRIKRRIRACNPWPVAHTTLDGQPLRCWRAGCIDLQDSRGAPGEVLDADEEGMRIGAGTGSVTLTEVQSAGRRRCAASEFARGRTLAGKRLGE